jgi:predicted Zn-dependent peptidase
MVLSPSLKETDIEKEKKVIFEEIRMYLDLPMHYVYDLLDGLIWPGHPLGLPLVGTYETVKNISRADLVRQKDVFYAPNNMAAVCCGNIDHGRFVKLMKTLFSGYSRAKVARCVPAGSCSGKSSLKFMRKDTEQTHICLGVKGVSGNDPQRYALSLLGIILGGNMSSRLFNEIREKRSLAYEIGASMKAYRDTGSFFVHAGIDNKKLKDAVSVIIDELSKIRKAPVTGREFSMAKEYFKSGLLMAMESTMSNMMFFGEQITSIGRIQAKEEILKAVDLVAPSDLQNIAKKIFVGPALRLAVIGPQSDDEIARVQSLF